jgi:hypothetical protein
MGRMGQIKAIFINFFYIIVLGEVLKMQLHLPYSPHVVFWMQGLGNDCGDRRLMHTLSMYVATLAGLKISLLFSSRQKVAEQLKCLQRLT